MVLYLDCQGYSIGLNLPTTPTAAADRLSALREGLETTAPVQISSVDSPVSNLYPYIQHTDLDNETDFRKLNVLAERIDSMPQEKQQLFSGALELECTGDLDHAIHIADNMDRFELFPKITTDEELGRFLVDTSFVTGKFSFPESARPYLDYAKIGAEQRDSIGGVYTSFGLVRRREESPVQTEGPREMLLTLTTSERNYPLVLPASEERLEHAKKALGVDDFSQAVIAGVEYVAPYLDQLIPADSITVENANEMAECLQEIKADGEMKKYCAALEVEEPSTFTEALDIAIDLDDYELISDNERDYGREALRRLGADGELLDTIDGYTDFDALGRAMMEEDRVRQTGFGLVRRLSKPFPPEQETGQTMM
ncbi:hypothetical protein D1646_03815 [Pseudoflavonifractor sp. 60]|uniref:DUF6329 domain-containing protein n=1 Tax=Pseudoflavonifractor sp. 60 TaxID=2304576 RepID=UPI0013695A23|nr:DUF6329 domain-containing protein [Pseudoflavonifractor sp. 60]NBI65951.1 hypothetical protein [Pseudoflavonifractor sp. 60]